MSVDCLMIFFLISVNSLSRSSLVNSIAYSVVN